MNFRGQGIRATEASIAVIASELGRAVISDCAALSKLRRRNEVRPLFRLIQQAFLCVDIACLCDHQRQHRQTSITSSIASCYSNLTFVTLSIALRRPAGAPMLSP